MSENMLPSLDNVLKLMQCLLGEGVQAKDAATGPDLSKPFVLASYVNEASDVRRVLACDLGLANSLGAAFSMIPAGVAAESTKSGSVPENIRVNLYEVLNVCVNLFSEQSKERLTLGELKVCPAGTPAPTLIQSVRYSVQVPRYSGGSMLAGSLSNP